MPHEVIMPALGMAQDTGLIVAWHKNPGDAVAEGDVLFEVETDKATMEVEAQAAGFLTQIRRQAGDDVPVGEVIALIGASPDAVQTDEAPVATAAPVAAIPDGNAIIMPALGMAQDTGLIVAWHKAPGDAVAASDILFEVETDKSTVEVEAGFDGFVAALLAEAGEDVPVGETIAVISVEKPANAIQVSRTAQTGAAAASPPPAAPAKTPAKAETRSAPKATKTPVPVEGGRILASPKARRLALEQGLDLARLVAAGHPQPYHVADLDVLKALPQQPAVSAQAAGRRLTADLPVDGFAAFAAWAAKNDGPTDANALLAGFAAASRQCDSLTVAVESLGRTLVYAVSSGPLGVIAEADVDAQPDLCVRDLRTSRISKVNLGAEDTPVLTLTSQGNGLAVTLECASHQLTAAEAVTLLSEFAGRMEQPLRHLL